MAENRIPERQFADEPPKEQSGMSKEECQLRATEKGFAEGGAHRCDQSGQPGSAQNETDKDWIEQQTGSVTQPGVVEELGYSTDTENLQS